MNRVSRVTRTGPVQMLGADSRMSANDEDHDMSEAAFLEADLAYDRMKDSGELERRRIAAAQEQELQRLRNEGLL
jgi:hypothetical protein